MYFYNAVIQATLLTADFSARFSEGLIPSIQREENFGYCEASLSLRKD